MTDCTWRFTLTDSGFFKEARHHGATSGFLTSLFPLPLKTFAGAIRTAIGNQAGVDWMDFKRGTPLKPETRTLIEHIGSPSDYGPLRFQGPWLCRNDERLYPMPALLSVSKQDKDNLLRIFPSEPIHSDMGQVYFPGEAFARTVPAAGYLTEQGLLQLLQGDLPDPKTWLKTEEIVEPETRLGIALDHGRRGVIERQLYQTQHLRFDSAVSLEIDVSGLNGVDCPQAGILPLGGEGRMASYSIDTGKHDVPGLPEEVVKSLTSSCFILILLSPVDIDPNTEASGLLPGFKKMSPPDDVVRWDGRLHGVHLRIWSALMGKPLRVGGWDLAKHQPCPVRSLIPAGATYFCDSEQTFAEIYDKLHGKTLLDEKEGPYILNRGLLAVAQWPEREQPDFKGRQNG